MGCVICSLCWTRRFWSIQSDRVQQFCFRLHHHSWIYELPLQLCGFAMQPRKANYFRSKLITTQYKILEEQLRQYKHVSFYTSKEKERNLYTENLYNKIKQRQHKMRLKLQL